MIPFCDATMALPNLLRHKIWLGTKTLQSINYQIDSINFFSVQKIHFCLFHPHSEQKKLLRSVENSTPFFIYSNANSWTNKKDPDIATELEN